MSPRLEKAIASLKSRSNPALGEAILLLGEVARYNRGGMESEVLREANEENLGSEELQMLERSLIDFVERDPFGPDACSAIWALCKFCDRNLLETYRAWLQRYVDHLAPSAYALGQLLVCLNDLGESAITGHSYSADEFGKNFDDAISYLRRQKSAQQAG